MVQTWGAKALGKLRENIEVKVGCQGLVRAQFLCANPEDAATKRCPLQSCTRERKGKGNIFLIKKKQKRAEEAERSPTRAVIKVPQLEETLQSFSGAHGRGLQLETATALAEHEGDLGAVVQNAKIGLLREKH